MSKQIYTQIIVEKERTVKDALSEIKLDLAMFSILVNEKKATLETSVMKGDKIVIIPQIKGG
jgi:molybdopterin converting factor small subunit